MSYSRTAVTLTSVRVSLASLAILYILAVSPRVLLSSSVHACVIATQKAPHT